MTSCHYARVHANTEVADLPTQAEIDIFAAPATPTNSPCPSSSCNVVAASSSQQADSIQGNVQHTNEQACSSSNVTEATTSKQRKGQMTLNWTFGEGSSVGSTFEVIARWLEPNRSATAGEMDTSILVQTGSYWFMPCSSWPQMTDCYVSTFHQSSQMCLICVHGHHSHACSASPCNMTH